MPETFITYKTFNDADLARQTGELLKKNGIPCEIEDYRHVFDVSFAYNTIDPNISLKLQAKDFVKARAILETYYNDALPAVNKDYYLFDFTNDELLSLLSKPDEWGEFDFKLAQYILKERGVETNTRMINSFFQERKASLSVQETVTSRYIPSSYISALTGGFFGFVNGYNLAFSKKTLYDGEQVFTYNKETRIHGHKILWLSSLSLVVWILVILWAKTIF